MLNKRKPSLTTHFRFVYNEDRTAGLSPGAGGTAEADVAGVPRFAREVRPEDDPSSEPASRPLPPDLRAAERVGVGARVVTGVGTVAMTDDGAASGAGVVVGGITGDSESESDDSPSLLRLNEGRDGACDVAPVSGST